MKLTLAPVLAVLLSVASAVEFKVTTTKGNLECKKGPAKKGDTLAIHYIGYLEDGTEFDNSWDRHRPYHFELGIGRVIKGWDEGLKGMCELEKRTLIVPPEMGYGENGYRNIVPPNAVLRFETQMVAHYPAPDHDEL